MFSASNALPRVASKFTQRAANPSLPAAERADWAKMAELAASASIDMRRHPRGQYDIVLRFVQEDGQERCVGGVHAVALPQSGAGTFSGRAKSLQWPACWQLA